MPTDWQFNEESLQEPRWNFPLRWMQRIVEEIRQKEIWYRKPILFMNGDEPQPFAEGTEQCGWLCQVSDIIPPEFPDHREIMTFDLISIYKEEADLLTQSDNKKTSMTSSTNPKSPESSTQPARTSRSTDEYPSHLTNATPSSMCKPGGTL